MKKILITSLKGGQAKSSSAISLVGGIKMLKPEARILLIEADPTGSVKTHFGLKLNQGQADFSSFLIDDEPLANCVQTVKTSVGEIDVMIASRRLAEADVRMAAYPRREETLALRFKKNNPDYDYVVVDTGPAMSLVLLNCMLLCSGEESGWLIPVCMEPFAVANLNYVFEQAKICEEFFERPVNIMGILPTQYDKRTSLSEQALDAVKAKFGPKYRIYDPIPIDSMVKRSQAKKQLIYDLAGSRAGDAYKKFSETVVGII